MRKPDVQTVPAGAATISIRLLRKLNAQASIERFLAGMLFPTEHSNELQPFDQSILALSARNLIVGSLFEGTLLRPVRTDLVRADLLATQSPTNLEQTTSDSDHICELRLQIVNMGPDRQLRLMVDIERGLLFGDDIKDADVILDILRMELRKFGLRPYRIGNPSRWFFAPLEPYLVDCSPRGRHIGYIARGSLAPIWRLIHTDLMPIEAKAYSELSRQALLANDTDTAVQLARRFQTHAITFLRPALTTPEGRENTRRRLAKHEASGEAVEDLLALFTIFNNRDDLEKIGARLPRKIANFSGRLLATVKASLDRLIYDDILVYALIQLMHRLASPAQLVRLAVKDAEGNDEGTIAGSPYAMTVTLVISHIEAMASNFRNDLEKTEPRGADGMRRYIHDELQTMETELDIANSSSWKEQLALTNKQFLCISLAGESCPSPA